MEENDSIEEILSAVNEIQSKKKDNKNKGLHTPLDNIRNSWYNKVC